MTEVTWCASPGDRVARLRVPWVIAADPAWAWGHHVGLAILVVVIGRLLANDRPRRGRDAQSAAILGRHSNGRGPPSGEATLIAGFFGHRPQP